MKFAVSFFSLLLVLIGAMLFVHYQVYSDHVDESEKAFSYSQEIEIEYRENSLDIRHQFKNLPDGELKIEWPVAATNMSCFLEAEYSCKRLAEDVNTFKAGETRTQSISYIIPLDGGLQSGRLMNDIFVSLTNGDVKFTTAQIVTDSAIAGQWVTGLPLIGQQSLKLVNFAMFSGTGAIHELYWQQSGIALQNKQDKLSIYGTTQTTTEFNNAIEQLPLLNDEHISIVQGTNEVASSGRILFLPELTITALQNSVILSQVNSLYSFGDSPLWLKNLVATYLTDIQFGDEKTKEIIETITNQMTEEQLAEWKARLKELQGQPVSLEILDGELSKVFGAYTRYLTMNNSTSDIYPFLFGDERDVFVDTTKNDDIQVIFKDGQVLYSAQPLLKVLGYEPSEGERGYYVKSATREFRFPREPGFYVFNQRRYDALSAPFVKVAGDYYVEETWLQRLFIVEVKKSEESITIVTTTEQ